MAAGRFANSTAKPSPANAACEALPSAAPVAAANPAVRPPCNVFRTTTAVVAPGVKTRIAVNATYASRTESTPTTYQRDVATRVAIAATAVTAFHRGSVLRSQLQLASKHRSRELQRRSTPKRGDIAWHRLCRHHAVTARDFTELEAWQLSKELQQQVLTFLDRPGLRQNFKFRIQFDDAASSAPRNIAEGYTRFQGPEFAQFLRVALGSLSETRNHLMDACDRGYITSDERLRCDILARRAIGATNALREYLLSPRNKKTPKKRNL